MSVAVERRHTVFLEAPSFFDSKEEAHMRALSRRMLTGVLLGMALTASFVGGGSRPAGAVEVGEPAPNFTLPSTNGVDISLSEFRGKKWVFLEFYGGDFNPT